MKLLIDADVLLYISAVKNEVATEVEPGYWTWLADEKKTWETIDETLSWYLKNLEGTECILCLSDVEIFRKKVADTYKGKRSSLRKPILLKKLRQDLLDRGARMMPTLEADDVLGILQTSMEDTCIVSIDKDMNTIPGKFFQKAEDGIKNISKEQADYYHMFQTLIGDSIDGYKGIVGVGAVAAHKILKKGIHWENVLSEFISRGYTEEYALQQARMARILRKEDYDFEKGEPILWTPK